MADIAIHLTAEEHRRLQQVADALGVTPENLAADELRRRYALGTTPEQLTADELRRRHARGSRHGHVVPLRHPTSQQGEG